MCIRTITHWLPCCHQRCTSIGLCSDAVVTLSATTTAKEDKRTTTERTKSAKDTKPGESNTLNPFDCPAGGPIFSDQASEEVCPVCKEVEVDAEAGDDEAAMLAGLGWESYFDRYG
ncbi:hypothetical protein Q7P36_011211 [Cladosporium allicinum]|jgi:hypothetical protein